MKLRRWFAMTTVVGALACTATAWAAAPTAEQALKLTPTQDNVDVDAPPPSEIENCTIKAEKVGAGSGWMVRDPFGQLLRRFVDSNSDNFVDMWCYYKNGIEVYRDIDADFNGKAEQFRWLHTAGTRWGFDKDADGKIDYWKTISAEEVSAEVIGALAQRDSKRFQALLLSDKELATLGLEPTKVKELTAKLQEAAADFAKLAKRQKTIDAKTQWLHFGAIRPGIVPGGLDGRTKDLEVYENALALVTAGGKTEQVQIGTLVRAGSAWRLIGAPKLLDKSAEVTADEGYFFRASLAARPEVSQGALPEAEQDVQQWLSELESLDKKLLGARDRAEQIRHNAARADLLEKIAGASEKPEDRSQWMQQLADTISAAAQSGAYPDGVSRLSALYARASDEGNDELAAYINFRYLTAEYGVSLQSPSADFPKIQARWLESLKKYITDYPKSPDTAEALLQVAIAEEFAGREDEAKRWYGQIVDRFPNAASAKKGAGAIARLDSVGKPMRLKGETVTGGSVDLAQYKGRVVLIHYWATWCQPCVADLAKIKELYARYGKSGFTPLGVSLDSKKSDLQAFLKKNRLPWVQVYEPGTLDGRLANEMGILTLPTMILVSKDGRVVNRNVHISELEAELKKHLQ